MLMVISPSKTLDESSRLPDVSCTQPVLLEDAGKLVGILRNYSTEKLGQLMDISEKLSVLNAERYQRFHTPFSLKNARPALYTFKGDVYEPMSLESYGARELAYAQAHLRILSGLYGVLRPLDLMQPYRLEMGTRLRTAHAKDLYQFWGARISQELNAALSGKKSTLVNLASEEYFAAIDKKTLKAPILTISFKEKQKDKLKVIGLFAKKARGMMVDFSIRNSIKAIEELKEFNAEGYRFQPKLSDDTCWVFAR